MSEPDLQQPDERRYDRFLSELDAVLSSDGAMLDESARAVDVSAAGFRAVTRAALKEGQSVDFELMVGNDKVKGRGRVAWCQQDTFQFDFYSAGIEITRMSWSDSSKLRSNVYTPGYDFVGLMRKMFWAVYVIIVVLALENVLFHQHTARVLAMKLAPVVGALVILGGALFALLG